MDLSGLIKAVRTRMPGAGTGPLLRFFLYALGLVEAFLLLAFLAAGLPPWAVVVLAVLGCGMFVYVVERVARLADKHPENLMLMPVRDEQYLEIYKQRHRGDDLIGEVLLPPGFIDADVTALGPEEPESGPVPTQELASQRRQQLIARNPLRLEGANAASSLVDDPLRTGTEPSEDATAGTVDRLAPGDEPGEPSDHEGEAPK